MALEMKEACMRCEVKLGHQDRCYICSYECTFCQPCTLMMDHICPNCGGDLVPRPTRKPRK